MLKLVKPVTRSARGREPRQDELGELAQAAQRGDERAIRTFLVAIGPQLLRVVRRVVGSEHPDVEDLAQEAAVHVLGALPRYRGECTVLHFVCRIAVLATMNARRKSAADKRATLEYSDLEPEVMAAPGPNPEAEAEARNATEHARRLLLTLPAPQAEALALHCVLGFTVAEIAESTGVSPETVRSRLRLGGERLRDKFLGDAALRESITGA